MKYEGKINRENIRCALIAARFNELVTRKLHDGALGELIRCGISPECIDEIWVPGAWEIPLALKILVESNRYHAVIAMAVVIKGETDHYRHIADSCISKLSDISFHSSIPVAQCVLTCNTMAEALERAGGKEGNRGSDAARVVLEMVDLKRQFCEQFALQEKGELSC